MILQDHADPFLEPVKCGNTECNNLVYRVTIFKFKMKINGFIHLERNVEKIYLYYPDPITGIKKPDNLINECPACGWILDIDKYNLDNATKKIEALKKIEENSIEGSIKETDQKNVEIFKRQALKARRNIQAIKEEWMLNDMEKA